MNAAKFLISEKGNQWIGGEDTGISAQGPAGPKGDKGDRGPQDENAAIGGEVVYPVIYSDGDSFLVASGMALPNSERYNISLVAV